MSYLSNGVGPSPFLTSSHHHFCPSSHFSSHLHYSTNSYTNTPSYLAGFAYPSATHQQKYFPKDMINILPGVTNLSSEQEQKLIHPLNTYTGNVFSTHKITSPFNRGQIYYGNKDPLVSSTCSSTSTIIDQITTQSYLNKKQNPFNKKYLMSDKNKQLENYAFYSSLDGYELSEYNRSKKKTIKNIRKWSNNKKEYSPLQQDMTEQVLKMISKENITVDRDGYQKNGQNYESKKQTLNSQRNPFENHILGQNYHEEYLVQSDVDEKQFGSFGQGKEQNNNLQVRDYENSKENLRIKKNDKADSIIVGLTKMVSNDQERPKNKQEKTKREPVFIDSEDDQRKSGTFKVPDAIIDEINNPRIPSNVIKRNKEHPSAFSHQKQTQMQRQKIRYSKQEAIQVGRNPPSKIVMRGKTYEKISL